MSSLVVNTIPHRTTPHHNKQRLMEHYFCKVIGIVRGWREVDSKLTRSWCEVDAMLTRSWRKIDARLMRSWYKIWRDKIHSHLVIIQVVFLPHLLCCMCSTEDEVPSSTCAVFSSNSSSTIALSDDDLVVVGVGVVVNAILKYKINQE